MCYPTAAYQMDWIAMSFHKIAPTMIGGALIGSGHTMVGVQSTYSRLYLLTDEVRDWLPNMKSLNILYSYNMSNPSELPEFVTT